ncbi:DUF2868 domain-containing protein [Candidatus Saccharibacteria bacterium]|nr:DUF2868 domain-containing protein [Candidatus Saccharibacteria bacterium]
MKKTKNFSKFVNQHQLASMIVIALLVASLMTGLSLWLYRTSGAFRLDLSRPGYEQVRGDVIHDSKEEKPFSSSGKLTPEVIDDFNARLNKQQNDLSKMGNFGGEALSDSNLGLEQPEQPEQSE